MGTDKFHGKALEHWLAIRVSGGDDARLDAVEAIRHLCEVEESVPLLVEALEDHFWRVRAAAAHAPLRNGMRRASAAGGGSGVGEVGAGGR